MASSIPPVSHEYPCPSGYSSLLIRRSRIESISDSWSYNEFMDYGNMHESFIAIYFS